MTANALDSPSTPRGGSGSRRRKHPGRRPQLGRDQTSRGCPQWTNWRRRSGGQRSSAEKNSKANSRNSLLPSLSRDRKSVVEGKSVDLGGGRIIKKKEDEPVAEQSRTHC